MTLVRLYGRLIGETYINSILIPHILPFITNERSLNNIIPLQQDNTSPDIANTVKVFIRGNDIQVLPWPAVSPDIIDCIEMCGHDGSNYVTPTI